MIWLIRETRHSQQCSIFSMQFHEVTEIVVISLFLAALTYAVILCSWQRLIHMYLLKKDQKSLKREQNI